MRVLRLEEVKENMVLEESISSPDGNMVLGQGTVLTAHWISRIKDWEIDQIKVAAPQKSEAFNSDELGDMLKELMMSSQKPVPKLQTGSEKFREVNASIKADLQRVFLQTRCNGKVPIEELQRLTLLIVQRLLPIKDGNCHVQAPGRGENYLYRHALDVAIYSGLMASWLGQTENEIREAVYAGLLHDIGKSQVYYEILTKPGPLSAKESMMAKAHVTHSFRLLNELPGVPSHIASAIFQHHERMDGSGYPRGLLAAEIEPLARILAVVDVFDAMTSDRSYRKAMSQIDAAEVMWGELRSGLDAQLLTLFLNKVRESLIDEEVILNDGRRGRVTAFLPFPEMKPILELSNGKMLTMATEPQVSVKVWL